MNIHFLLYKMTVQRKQLILIFILLAFIFIQNFIILNQKNTSLSTIDQSKFNIEINDLQSIVKSNINQFASIGTTYKTDKISIHHYESLYGIHVGKFRQMKINFLEIGIGCGMPYGAGKSIPLWKEFMPEANIYELEFDANCAKPFRSQVKQMFTGDQSDLNLLRKIGQEVGFFNVIVDDGGHSRKQQVNSLIGLWPFLSSEGVYIIEDMYHSFVDHKNYNDNNESSIDLIIELLILLNDPLEIDYISSLNAQVVKPNISIRAHAVEISKSLLSINCFKRACVLHKK
jgi:hypothetical protein